jgi:hypothetical protein
MLYTHFFSSTDAVLPDLLDLLDKLQLTVNMRKGRNKIITYTETNDKQGNLHRLGNDTVITAFTQCVMR